MTDNTVQGNIASTTDEGHGGGFYLYNSGATLSGNTVQGNIASIADAGIGGGLWVDDSAITLGGNMIISNTASTAASGSGGGLYFSSSQATLTYNTVAGNTGSTASVGFGGGLMVTSGGPVTLSGNTVVSNTAVGYISAGGGVYVVDSNATLSHNLVAGNTASTGDSGYGGGLVVGGYAVTLDGNAIISNTATLSPTATDSGGGGLVAGNGGSFTMTNNLVVDNRANTEGSGLWFEGDSYSGVTSGRLLHTTIAGNHGSEQVVYVGEYATLAFTNTIISGYDGVGVFVDSGGTAALEATLWHGNGTDTGGTGTIVTGTVNVWGDPAFADPTTWDYHLTAGSAAIGRGIDAGVLTDMDGDPRDVPPDIGADEYDTACYARLNNGIIYPTVQAAVDASTQPSDLVKVAGYCAGVDFRAGLSQTVYLSKTLALQGGYTVTNWTTPDPEANPTTLDAQGQGRALVITGSITPTIEGLRLTGGDATGLGGSPGEHDTGGGVYVYGAAATISDCLVYSNTASTTSWGFGGGLALYDWGDATLRGNTIVSNTASTGGDGLGGGLYLDSGDNTILHSNTVRGNTASIAGWGWGGGLAVYQSATLLSGNVIVSNTASIASLGWGGGLDLSYSGDAVLAGNTVQGNTASVAYGGYGGGLNLLNSSATLSGNTVQGNVASETYVGSCGGLLLYESHGATLQGNWIQDNRGSIDSVGTGGGLCLYNSDGVALDGNRVQDNVASMAAEGYGGGLVINESDATLKANTIVSNAATLNPTAYGWGGGLRVESGSSLTLTNNVVAGNQANSEGSGLWLNAGWGLPTTGRLLHNTIADNAAGGSSGQGVYVGAYTTLAFTNTIVAGHEGTGVFVDSGGTAALEVTLWHDNGADTGGNGTIITGTVNVYGDPAFVDPTTWDYHLTAGSAAIDAGVDAGVMVDMDGDPRPAGAGYDIGADEYGFLAGVQLAPDRSGSADPGMFITYSHTLTNTGNGADIFALSHASSQGWAVSYDTPIALAAGQTTTLVVTVTVPVDAVSGTVDSTVITATSQADPGVLAAVADTTAVMGEVVEGWDIYLPIVLRNYGP